MTGAPADASGLEVWLRQRIPGMQGWCTADKAVRLAELVIERQPPVSIEIGIFGGRSLLALAAAHRLIKKGHAWGFDPWTAQSAVEGKNDPANDEWWAGLDYESIYRSFIETVQAFELLPWCRWTRDDSRRHAGAFDGGSIGLLHQDGNHSLEVSTEEVHLWAPKIASGGLWILDDADWKTTEPAQALLSESGFELLEDYHTWRVYRKNG